MCLGVSIGGEPACYIVENHLSRFVEGQVRQLSLSHDSSQLELQHTHTTHNLLPPPPPPPHTHTHTHTHTLTPCLIYYTHMYTHMHTYTHTHTPHTHTTRIRATLNSCGTKCSGALSTMAEKDYPCKLWSCTRPVVVLYEASCGLNLIPRPSLGRDRAWVPG